MRRRLWRAGGTARAAKVLDDVLDGFCTVEHARIAYGVIVDAARRDGRRGGDKGSSRAHARSLAVKPAKTAEAPQPTAPPRAAQPPSRQAPVPADCAERRQPSSAQPIRPTPRRRRARPVAGHATARALAARRLRGLRDAYGDNWSFEIVRHSAHDGVIEVVGQLRANGSTVRETAVVCRTPGRSLGELLRAGGR